MSLTADEIIAALEDESDDRIPIMDRIERKADADALIRALQRATRPFTRHLICDIFGRTRDARALGILLEVVSDPDVGVRAAATDAIGKVFGYVEDPPLERRSEALMVLLDRWQQENSDDVRSTLAQTLALLGDQSVVPILRTALDAPDRRVRTQAEWGLRYLARDRQ